MPKRGSKGCTGGVSQAPQQQSNVCDGTCSNGGSLQAPMTPQPAVEIPQEQPVENIPTLLIEQKLIGSSIVIL